MAEISKVIGLMSGTSLDGVDAALIETDGEDIARPLAGLTIPYDPQTRALLRAALDEAAEWQKGAPVPHSIRDAERLLTEAHAEAVKALLKKPVSTPDQVSLIGLSWPDHPAPAGAALDLADRRRRAAGPAHRHRCGQ